MEESSGNGGEFEGVETRKINKDESKKFPPLPGSSHRVFERGPLALALGESEHPTHSP